MIVYSSLFHKAFVIAILLTVVLSFVLFYLDHHLSTLLKRELDIRHKIAALALGTFFWSELIPIIANLTIIKGSCFSCSLHTASPYSNGAAY